ncbi:hypothetical protein FKW77_001465 [Venturia effusa]|uniref:Voltage-gated hydrogen channel 1 n=1 Tax=Venturia effusa TaxID=50376 RepID=A0A517LKV2_9PEZI|nr:hypothetical protein FKW77_001465 [Venturia effusa]
MPPKATTKRPRSSPHLREDVNTTSRRTQADLPARPVEHVRERRPSTEACSKRGTHPKYTGFHPKSAKPKRTASEVQLANTLSEQLQADIQAAANEFSAQVVHTANALANDAADAVGSDVQAAAGAISDAVATTSSKVEATIEDTIRGLGSDAEEQVAKFLTAKNIEKAALTIVHSLAHGIIDAKRFIMSEHPNNQVEGDGETDPLLPAKKKIRASKNFANIEHWNHRSPKKHAIQTTRGKVKYFLCSKVGHYAVLTLVALDVAGIIAAFVISLFRCEKRWGNKGWNEALTALDIASLVFSSLFMLELVLSIWAFGPTYFRSRFHIIDALVVITGFALDLSLHGGTIEEAASLIVVLRLWRVFKIIEELSLGAQEQVDALEDEIELLRDENLRLKSAGLAGRKEGESWRKELEALKEVKERLEEQLKSEERYKERLEEMLEESEMNQKKGNDVEVRKTYVRTEPSEKNLEGSSPEEEEREYIGDYEEGSEDELDGGDHNERAAGYEHEYQTLKHETREVKSGEQKGMLSRVATVLSGAHSRDEIVPQAGAGEEDSLTLIGDSGKGGPETDGNITRQPEESVEGSSGWGLFERLRGSREWGGSYRSHGSEESAETA